MIRFGGRPVAGFGVGDLTGPSIAGVPMLAVLAGAGAGVGAALFARHLGARPWEAAASGVGTGIAALAATRYLVTLSVHGVEARASELTRRASELTRDVENHASKITRGVETRTSKLKQLLLPSPAAYHSLTPRGSQIMSTPGGFVSTVQQALTNAGFDTQGVDNEWGSHTSAAASAFQSANGMTPTGLPEPELLRALGIAVPPYPGATDIANALTSSLGGVVEPKDAVKVMLNESGLDPAAINHNSDGNPVAAGVFQLLVSALPMPLADWTALTAAQQIPYAAKFWQQKAADNGAPTPVSARDLYWLNYLPATYVPGAADDYQFVRSDDTYLPRGGDWTYAKGFYTQNTGLDHPLTPGGPPKGYITAGDMALAAARGAMNNPATYAAIADALAPQGVA